MPRQITILGSTGSIGVSTLDVIQRNSEKFQVFALTANKNIELLVQQCSQFSPQYVVIADATLRKVLVQQLDRINFSGTVLTGVQGLVDVVSHANVDSVMAAIVGAAGLEPTLAAAKAGKRILLANKEVLVMAGDIFMHAVRENNATLLPVDSEHNAIFQCFKPEGVNRIILTASGGPFRNTPMEELATVTPKQACAHPNWDMGRKISVDSATMMNKALELIEAHYLFDLPADKIDVVIHPQSIAHSFVEYADGSILAQMGNPDMRTPIANALAYPERIPSGVPFLDLAGKNLHFESLDETRFPAITLAYQAIKIGGTAATIINAANEVAVEAFLNGKIKFTDIYTTVNDIMRNSTIQVVDSLASIISADKAAREQTLALINKQ